MFDIDAKLDRFYRSGLVERSGYFSQFSCRVEFELR